MILLSHMDCIIWTCIKKSYVTALRSLSIPMAVYRMIFSSTSMSAETWNI